MLNFYDSLSEHSDVIISCHRIIYQHFLALHTVFEGYTQYLEENIRTMSNDTLAQVIPMRAGCLSVSLKRAILHAGQWDPLVGAVVHQASFLHLALRLALPQAARCLPKARHRHRRAHDAARL